MQTLPQVGMGCPAPHPGFWRVPLELLGSEVLGRAWVQKGGPECSVHMYRTASCSISDGRDPIRTRAKAIDENNPVFFRLVYMLGASRKAEGSVVVV